MAKGEKFREGGAIPPGVLNHPDLVAAQDAIDSKAYDISLLRVEESDLVLKIADFYTKLRQYKYHYVWPQIAITKASKEKLLEEVRTDIKILQAEKNAMVTAKITMTRKIILDLTQGVVEVGPGGQITLLPPILAPVPAPTGTVGPPGSYMPAPGMGGAPTAEETQPEVEKREGDAEKKKKKQKQIIGIAIAIIVVIVIIIVGRKFLKKKGKK